MEVPYFHQQENPDYWRHLLDHGIKIKQIDKKNADLINRFIEYQTATKNIGAMRRSKLTQTLLSWRKFYAGNWPEITMDELTAAVNKLREYKTWKGKGYSPNTIADHIRIIKLFYTWLIKRNLSTLTRDEISDLHTPVIPETLEAKDLLVRDEIAEMIASCKNENSARDQAIIASTFESAARIKEIANATWGNLEYTPEGVIRLSIFDIKTQKMRHPPLLMSVEYLAAWRRVYPGTPDGDAFIFVDSVSGTRMQYRAIAYVITRAAARAGIQKKKVTPHRFRKARISEMARDGYQESVIKEVAWANQNTTMMKIYMKLGSEDVYNEFLEKSGIRKKQEAARQKIPIQCPFCFAMNSPVAQHCHMCGMELTEQARNYRENWKKAVGSNPDFMIGLLTEIKEEMQQTKQE